MKTTAASILTFILLSILIALPASGEDGARPNVILSDDHGFRDYGFMGHEVAQTPNLDRMASQSLLYTRGYVMPVCSPSLACLLTGKLDDFLTKHQLAETTVIIYMADNGWDAEQGNRAKLSPYELGIRTPMFVRWPGKVQPLRDDETLASIIDFVPTVLKTCGAEVPADLPGIDLTDREAMTARKSIFIEAYTHDIAELGKPEKSLATQVIIDGWFKLLLPGPHRPDKGFASAPRSAELFDLKVDPLEKQDLAAEKPDVVKRLEALQKAEWSVPK